MRRHDDTGERDWRSAAALRFAVAFVLMVVGIVLEVATKGTASIIGWGIVGLAVTLAISLIFLEVGYSEDRARARESDRTRPRGSDF
jgi:multisubunit Na+/H+ antiporter MnhC subunit